MRGPSRSNWGRHHSLFSFPKAEGPGEMTKPVPVKLIELNDKDSKINSMERSVTGPIARVIQSDLCQAGFCRPQTLDIHSELHLMLPAKKSIASRLGWRDCDVAKGTRGLLAQQAFTLTLQ